MERIPVLMKELRGNMQRLKTKKLMRLDRSDRILLEGMLERLVNETYRIEALGNSQCSCVLELYEYMGGTVPTAKG